MPEVSEGRLPGISTSRAAAAVLFVSIVVFYTVLGLLVLEPDAVYSGDIGVKYVQARALAASRFTSLDIPYPGRALDADREFFPMRPPFVMVARGATQAIFSPASALIQAAAVAIAGMKGMVAVSLAAAAVVLLAAWSLAGAAEGAPVLLALGLAGPLWFYAVSGWEHAPAIALSTAAFAVAIASPWRMAPLLAGICLGAGATLRDEVLLLAPGLALAVWLRTRRAAPILWTSVGAIVPLTAAAAMDVWWFQRPVAAHLRHAVHLLQSVLRVNDAPNPDVPVLHPLTVRERYETVIQYWLLGYGRDAIIAAYAAGLAAALVIRFRLRSSIGILAWLGAVIVLASIDLHELVTAPKWLAGLHRVSPYLVFALLPLPLNTERRGWFGGVIIFTTAAYLALAFAGADTTGGKSLGPRLLLPLMPLLTVSAVSRMSAYLKSPARFDRWIGGAGATLVAMSIVMHVYGTVSAYVHRNRDDASAVVAVTASPERITVADDPFTAQLLFPLYYRKIVFLADSPDLGTRLGTLLAKARVSGAVLVSREEHPSVQLAPLRLDRTEQRGRMVLQYWKR